jgi:hypothetical protein
MMRFDHLALGAATLQQGIDHVTQLMGVEMTKGGAHPDMATHNRVMATGEDTFFEVIAIDPDATAPSRPRWFSLDEANFDDGPRPYAIILDTFDLEGAIGYAADHGIDCGVPTLLTRDSLKWHFSLRDDGRIPLEGAAPLIIEWPKGPHPATKMEDHGLRFEAITVTTPYADQLNSFFRASGSDLGPVEILRGTAHSITAQMRNKDGKIIKI